MGEDGSQDSARLCCRAHCWHMNALPHRVCIFFFLHAIIVPPTLWTLVAAIARESCVQQTMAKHSLTANVRGALLIAQIIHTKTDCYISDKHSYFLLRRSQE